MLTYLFSDINCILSLKFITLIVYDCRMNHLLFALYKILRKIISKVNYLIILRLIYGAKQLSSKNISYRDCDIHSLTIEQ